MQDITTRTVSAPKFRFPLGGNFELTLNVTGLSLTGKTVRFAAESQSVAAGLERYLLDSVADAAEIAVSGSTITIDLPPSTVSNDDAEYSLSDLIAAGLVRYSVTITDDADDDEVKARVQGDAVWIRDVGKFTNGSAGAPVFDLTIASGNVVSLTISTVGGGAVDGPAIAALVHGATEKVTLADDDEIGGADSSATFGWKKWKWSTIRAAVSTLITNAITALNLGTAAQQPTSAFEAAGSVAALADSVTTALGGKQTSDATLTALAALVTAANKLIYATGEDTFSTTDFTAAARTFVAAASAADQRTALGLVIGTDVLAPGGPIVCTTLQTSGQVNFNSNVILSPFNFALFRYVGNGYSNESSIDFNSAGTVNFSASASNAVPGVADANISRLSPALLAIGSGGGGPGSFAGSLKLTNIEAVGGVTLGEFTVGALPTASSNARKRYEVTDANSPTLGATVSGGGSGTPCTVRSDGTNWVVIELL